MKKWIVALLALMLCLPMAALGEGITIPQGQVVELVSGAAYSFGGEEVTVTVDFSSEEEEDWLVKATVRVGSQEATYEGAWLMDKAYIALLDGYEPYILVGDYGPSNDSWTEVFYYDAYTGTLTDIGGVGELPTNLHLNWDGTFSGMVRAEALYTWFRPADFKIARGYLYTEDYDLVMPPPAIVEIPRYSYPMGAIAYPTMDIPVCADTGFSSVAFTVPAGERLLFAATDDATWIQVAWDGGENGMRRTGYLQIDPENLWTSVLLNGKSYNGYEIFPGLLYAD